MPVDGRLLEVVDDDVAGALVDVDAGGGDVEQVAVRHPPGRDEHDVGRDLTGRRAPS